MLTDSPLPRYYQIRNELLDRIHSEELRPKGALTPEIDLAREYGVSRNTVRRAIRLLVKDGYLTRIPGKGTFVLNRQVGPPLDQWVVSSIEEMIEVTKQTRVVYEPRLLVEKVPDFIMKDLRLKSWNKVWHFRGLKYRGAKLISYVKVYLPYEIGMQIDVKERGDRTSLRYLREKLHIDFNRVDQCLTIEPGPREERRKLKCRPGESQVIIKRIYFCDDQPIEVSINHYPGNSFSLFYRIFKVV